MRYPRLASILILTSAATLFSACTSTHPAKPAPLGAPLGSSTSAAAAIVHVTIRFTGTASGASVVDRSDFDAPPLGLGTFTQQALEYQCICAKGSFHFQTGDELHGTIHFNITAQSNPPPPALGGVNTLDNDFTVDGGTGRFAAASGVLRGPGQYTTTTADPNPFKSSGTFNNTLMGDITLTR